MTTKKYLLFILLASALLAAVLPSCRRAASPSPAQAQGAGNTVPAPDFSLAKLDGQFVTLSDLKGQPVLINFWTTWCPGCRDEMPLLQSIYEERQGDGLVVLAVDMAEKPEQVKKFMEDNKLTFTALLDLDNRVSATYGIRLIPTTVLVDKSGNIRDVRVGAYQNRAQIRDALKKIM